MEDKTLSSLDSSRKINTAVSANFEEKSKKGVMINLGLLNDKPGEEVDETPTPTRLIRNCEEVGLFQDLQNVNPFDEYFKKAVENRDYGMPSSNSTQPEDDSLHTPQIYLPQSVEPIEPVMTKATCMGLDLDLIDSNNDDDENPLLIIINSDDENDVDNGQESRNLNNNDVHNNTHKPQNIHSHSQVNMEQDIREINQSQNNISDINKNNSNNGTHFQGSLNMNITKASHIQNNSNINIDCINDVNNIDLHNQNQIKGSIIEKIFSQNNNNQTAIDCKDNRESYNIDNYNQSNTSQNKVGKINLDCMDEIGDNIKEKVKSALIQKAQALKTVPMDKLLEKPAVASSEEAYIAPPPLLEKPAVVWPDEHIIGPVSLRNSSLIKAKSKPSDVELERRTANRYAQARTRARRRKQLDDMQNELVTLRREKVKLVKMNLALMDRVTRLEKELQKHTTEVLKNDEVIPLHVIQKTKNGGIVKVAQVPDRLNNPTNASQGLKVITPHSSQNTLVNTSTTPIDFGTQSTIASVPTVSTHSGITILDNTQIVPQQTGTTNAVFVIMAPQNSSTTQNGSTAPHRKTKGSRRNHANSSSTKTT